MEQVAGADLHKGVTQLALLRDGQPPSQARFANDRASVEGALTRLPAGTTIAVESTGSWWWFVDAARRLSYHVVLSHPKLTQAIAAARLKSDKVDAVMLARLLKADLLPMVWIPAERERHIRELLAQRDRVVRTRTAVINERHALSIVCGISRSHSISGIARRANRGSPRRSAATVTGLCTRMSRC